MLSGRHNVLAQTLFVASWIAVALLAQTDTVVGVALRSFADFILPEGK